ncbi:MAG: hypothetical protein U0271_44250 [Polyangiaceae bacterium]
MARVLPRQRALLLAVSFVATACQVVFGLDEYETGAPGAAGAAAGGSGATSSGGAGGSTTSAGGEAGAGGTCDCGFPAVWKPLVVATDGPGDALTMPTKCGDGTPALNLFSGEPTGACEACACAASGCEVPGLECFTQTNCEGTLVAAQPSTSCGFLGDDVRSCRLAGDPTPAACDASGGALSDPAPVFDHFFTFCPETSCCEVLTAGGCVVAEGIVADACPAGFDNRYQLHTELDATCPACGCTPRCENPAYQVGWSIVFASCGGDTVDDAATCTDVTLANGAVLQKQAACDPDPPDAHAADVALLGEHTVCCSYDLLAGVPPN